jgi:hypothetical protein
MNGTLKFLSEFNNQNATQPKNRPCIHLAGKALRVPVAGKSVNTRQERYRMKTLTSDFSLCKNVVAPRNGSKRGSPHSAPHLNPAPGVGIALRKTHGHENFQTCAKYVSAITH